MHLAAGLGHGKITEMLLAAGAAVVFRVRHTPPCRETVLPAAVGRCFCKHHTASELTPLLYAAAVSKPHIIRFLLRAGANVNASDADGCSALTHAVQSVGDPTTVLECVRILLAAGAAVNSSDNKGSTALHKAADLGVHSVVSALLAADANARDKGDMTPHVAQHTAQGGAHHPPAVSCWG